MKKYTKALLIVLLVVFLAAFMVGCNYINVLINRFKPQNNGDDTLVLAAPSVQLHGNVLTWDGVDNADEYEVRYVDRDGNANSVTVRQCTYDAAQLNLEVGTYQLSVRAKKGDIVGEFGNECTLTIRQTASISVTPVVYYIDETTLAVQSGVQEGALYYCVTYGDITLQSETPFIVVHDVNTAGDMSFIFSIKGDDTHDFGNATLSATYSAADKQPIAQANYDKGSGDDFEMALWLASDVQLDGQAIRYKGHTTLSIDAEELAPYGYGKHFLQVTYATGVWRGMLNIWDSRPLQLVNTKGEPLSKVDYRLARADLNIYWKQYNCVAESVTMDGVAWTGGTQYSQKEMALTLAKSAMATLTEGDHTLTVQYTYVQPEGDPVRNTVALTVHCVGAQSFEYDKAVGGNLQCTGLPVDTNAILGGDITLSQYMLSRNAEDADAILSAAYLTGLKAGIYTLAAVTGNVDTDESFDIKVCDSTCKPTHVRLDYDTDASLTYVRFDCDCGANAHRYTLDGIEAVTDRYAIALTGLNRKAKHTLSVRCDTNNTVGASFSIDSQSNEAYTYVNRHFDFAETRPDYFIASQEEFNWFLRYLAYGGQYDASYGSYGISQAKVFIGAGLLSKTYTLSNMLDAALDSFLAPAAGTGGVGDPANPNGSITLNSDYSCALNVYYIYNSPLTKTATTGMAARASTDPRALLTTYSGHTPYIVGQGATIGIDNLVQLANIPYGVRPVFEGNSADVQHAQAVYKAALDVCTAYIDDGMTDYGKVEVLYNYLCTNVTYNDYALVWFDLDNYAKYLAYTKDEQAQQKLRDRIDGYIGQSRYASMSSVLGEIRAMTFGNAQKALADRMNNTAFDMYGALVDKVAVCDGISEAFRLLCWMENIPCLKVTGIAQNSSGNSENHAWNKVYIDNEWYAVDVTWGRSTDVEHTFDVVTHQYCMVPDAKLYINHFENGTKAADAHITTVATATQYDYYTMTVLYDQDMVVTDWNDLKTTLKELHKHNDVQFVELRFDFAVGEADVANNCTAEKLGFGLSYSYANGYLMVWFK